MHCTVQLLIRVTVKILVFPKILKSMSTTLKYYTLITLKENIIKKKNYENGSKFNFGIRFRKSTLTYISCISLNTYFLNQRNF